MVPSGCKESWRLYRHCCCRYGWYPVVVLPIAILGCFLSLYSTSGCEFVKLDVGFTPSNSGWSNRTAEFGLLFQQSGVKHQNHYRNQFHDGCGWHDEEFSDYFVTGDRTWKMARIMAIISVFSSVVAAGTVLLFVISPIPISFFWPGIVLPAMLISFIAEGSKFLIFDTALCRNNIWISNAGETTERHRAADCTMGHTAYAAIAAATVHFIALSFVCLRAPERRALDEDFGSSNSTRNAKAIDIEEGVSSAMSFGGRSVKSAMSSSSRQRKKNRPDSPSPSWIIGGRDKPSEKGISGDSGDVGIIEEIEVDVADLQSRCNPNKGRRDIDQNDYMRTDSQPSHKTIQEATIYERDIEVGGEDDEDNDGEGGNQFPRTISDMLVTKSFSDFLMPTPAQSRDVTLENDAVPAIESPINMDETPCSPTSNNSVTTTNDDMDNADAYMKENRSTAATTSMVEKMQPEVTETNFVTNEIVFSTVDSQDTAIASNSTIPPTIVAEKSPDTTNHTKKENEAKISNEDSKSQQLANKGVCDDFDVGLCVKTHLTAHSCPPLSC